MTNQSSPVTDTMVERAWAAIVGADVAGICFQASIIRADLRTALESVIGPAQAPVLSDAWCDAFLKATGEWIEAHEAETECGVPMECEITQADADEFNAQAREAIRKGYAAAVTSTDKATEDDCDCVGAVIGQHNSSCPYSASSKTLGGQHD